MGCGRSYPLLCELASLSLTANLEPNRYWYPTSPARSGNGVVYHSLSKLQDSVRCPVLSLPRSFASTLLNGLISPAACFGNGYPVKQEDLKCSLFFISVQATTRSFAASLTFIFKLMPRSNSRPLINLLK